MGQVPSRGPYDSNRLLAARSRSRSRGSLLSRSSSAAVTVTSSGPEQVRSFLSVDEDSDTIFGRLDREEKRGNEIWTEQSIYGSMTGHSAATVPTSRNGCCSYGARCSLASANPAAAVDGKASMPGYEKPEGTRYLQHSSYHCECSNTDDRPRRSTLPGLSSSSSSSSANTALPGRCLMRPPAVTAEPYRMDLTESSNRNPRNRLRKMASLASSLRSFAMGKRSTPSVRSERSMDSITSDSCEGHSTPTKDPSSGLVVVTTPTPIYSANGSASSFVVSANHVDATCTSELSTMCASPVDWQSSSHVRSSSSNTATTSFPFTDVLEYVPVRRGSVQEMPLRKKCSIIGSFQRRSPKDSPQMGIATDIGAMKSCPLVASASYDPTMQCTTRQNSISTDGKGSKSRPKLNIITELNPNVVQLKSPVHWFSFIGCRADGAVILVKVPRKCFLVIRTTLIMPIIYMTLSGLLHVVTTLLLYCIQSVF
ncbi:hypothetical protein BDF19DRAFT_489777 [Syncephalis fuscata]|nr:hypothetical protein BDF19DRAFT_489777 [Syncephalis fuscata]